MKIFVTGSSGFIGFNLIKRLLIDGHEIIGIDNHNNYYNQKLKLTRLRLLDAKNFTFYEQDLNSISIDEKNIDVAINLAAQAGVRVSKEKEYLYEASNINGFSSFCNFCIKKNIKKVIYASSSSVYSDIEKRGFCENDTVLKPKSEYGKSKLLNEKYASQIANKHDFSMIGLRFFSVYGPFGRPDMAYYSFTEAIKKQETITLNNDGTMYRDMTYVDDIINGILGAIDYVFTSKNIGKNEIFNLGNNNPIQTSYLLQTLEDILGKTATVKFCKTKNEMSYTHADITKAKNLLGYNPEIKFTDGIKRFLEWHKNYENI